MSAPETQRQRRGHDFYPPASELAALPALYGTEATPAGNKMLRLHYFVGGCDWWVVEYDPAETLAFGYACLGDPVMAEWGYVNLVELEALRIQGLWVVERDLHWKPKTAREAGLPGRFE